MNDYQYTRAYDESRDPTDRHGTPDPQAVGDGGGHGGTVATEGVEAVFDGGELVTSQTTEVQTRGAGPETSTWHNVGGKEPGGKPTRISRWTFATKMVRDEVLSALPADGRVLNACAGETKLHKRGVEFVRNDIDSSIDADYHRDMCELGDVFRRESFDAVVFDPPFDPGRAAKLYEGMNGQQYSAARAELAPLVKPGGVGIELGWNSWTFAGIDGWEWVDHHLFRQASFKGDVHLAVSRKINQQTLGGES